MARQPRGAGGRTALAPVSGAAFADTDSSELIDLTVVLPFYNAGAQVQQTVERTVEVLRGRAVTFEVIAVSDGSTDGCEKMLGEISPEHVEVVVLPARGGKGQAVRVGLMRGRGRYLGFLDGDGDVPPDLLADFLEVVASERPDVLIGSKRHPASQVVYPFARRLYSWGYQQLVRRDVLAGVLPLLVEQGYAFDLELLVVADRLGYHHLVEAPVRIGRRFSSTVSPKVVGEMLADTFAIWWRLHLGRDYGPRNAAPGADASRTTRARRV